MRILKKILLTLLIIILTAAIAGFLYVRHLGRRALPDYNSTVTIPGIKEAVTVYRDDFAVPHIYAKNETDLYRTVGYVMAQDRLWQMDLIRRVTMGRLAEIFGQRYVDSDVLMRALRISEKSKQLLTGADPDVLNALSAFTAGVNSYLDENKNHLPPEFTILGYAPEPWEMFHSVNLIGYMAWDLSFAWDMEIFLSRIKKGLPDEKFNLLLPVESRQKTVVAPGFSLDDTLLSAATKPAELGVTAFDGSNNWVVSGSKSTTGKPLFANDMHLGLFIPGIWYQVHQVVENPDGQGKTLNVTGVALPGAPFVVAGHNERIAWGMTNVMVDDMDFYLETVNPKNRRQYLFNGQWRNMECRHEVIKIKGSHRLIREIKFTHRGPVVSRFHKMGRQVVSMRWLGSEPSNELRSVYLLNRAGNWAEFREAVRDFIAISQNIAYADVDGNIGIQVCAGVPIRKGTGPQPIFPAPGETDEYDWTGLVPFEKLPYVFNPACGHVSSANNRSAGDDYPYYISRWFMPPHRIERIREMLESKPLLGIEDFREMQADWKSKHVEKHLPAILAVLEKIPPAPEDSGAPGFFGGVGNDGKVAGGMDWGVLTPLEQEAVQILKDWDGVMQPGKAAPLIFDSLYLTMAFNLVSDELDVAAMRELLGKRILVQNLILNTWAESASPSSSSSTSASSPSPALSSSWCDNIQTDSIETFSDWIRDSFKETVDKLRTRYGADPGKWEWGKVHQFTLSHPLSAVHTLELLFDLDRGPYPAGGSFHTVCPYSYSLGHPFSVSYGASHRHIYSTADWDQSLTVIPTGISGIPASPFYCDQTALYIANEYHPDYFSKECVAKNARFTMRVTGGN